MRLLGAYVCALIFESFGGAASSKYQMIIFTQPRSGSTWLYKLTEYAHPCVHGIGEGNREHSTALRSMAGLPPYKQLLSGPPMDAVEVTRLRQKSHLDEIMRLPKSSMCPSGLSLYKAFCPIGISPMSVNITIPLGTELRDTGTSILLLLRRNLFENYVSRQRGYSHCADAACGQAVNNKRVKVNLRNLKAHIDHTRASQQQCLENVTKSVANHRVLYYEDLQKRPEREIQEEVVRFATNGTMGFHQSESLKAMREKRGMVKSSDASHFNETIENWEDVVVAMESWGPAYAVMLPDRTLRNRHQ